MTRTYWKWTIGALMVSLGGLVALADSPSKNGVSCTGKALPVAQHTAFHPTQDAPIPVAPPSPTQLPTIPIPTTPKTTAPITPIPTVPELSAPLAPTIPAIPVEYLTPNSIPIAPPPPARIAQTETAPLPRPFEMQYAIPVPSFASTAPTMEWAPPASAPVPPKMPSLEIVPSLEVKPSPVEPAKPTIPMVTAPRTLVETPAPSSNMVPNSTEKKLKVNLYLSEDRPQFYVKDGEEVYLKVVSDQIDVKSPTNNASLLATLKSTGRVLFITPGGEGTCDELIVVPGSGVVQVSGKVSFKYTWGNAETIVSGDKMTFRLGTMPGTASPSLSSTIPAGGTVSR